MTELYDVESLAIEITRRSNRDRHLVGIEGHSTAGKTTLAKSVQARLSAGLVRPDCHLVRFSSDADQDQNYVERLDLVGLDRDLSAKVSLHSVVIIESICLREVLRQLGVDADIFVYCKRISPAGIWQDDPAFGHQGGNWADRQSRLYHREESPLENADLVFINREQEPDDF
jgi:hypothetical protein